MHVINLYIYSFAIKSVVRVVDRGRATNDRITKIYNVRHYGVICCTHHSIYDILQSKLYNRYFI